MLSQLLRRMILGQLLVGALIGFGLHMSGYMSTAGAALLSVAMPFIVMVAVDIYSGILSRGPEPMHYWWKSLFGEFRAGVVYFIFRQPWTRWKPALQPATGAGVSKGIPVVLVHGFVCNHRMWDHIAPGLRARGHDVFAVNLEPLGCSIDRYAPIVEAAVQALLAHSGQRQVAIIGHSMGGLATRAWLRAFGSACAARVITLGTPHVGTAIPQHFPSTNGIQMAYGSAWLRELSASESAATRSLFRIAITPQDNIVYPQREQTLAGITPAVFPGIGHLQMCLDAEVIAWVHKQLEEACPA